MTRLFAWFYLRTQIPRDWEMVVYSLDETYGSVEFATRAGVQAKLKWRKGRVSRSSESWEWNWDSEAGALRAQCAVPEEKVQLIWTFPLAEEVLARQVVAASGPLTEGKRELTVQGIEAVLPEGYKPVEVQLHPANVMLALEGTHRSRIVHRSWGLPQIVLQGETPQAFFHRLLVAMQFQVQELAASRVLNYEAQQASFTSRGLSPLARLCFQRAKGKGWIWVEPAAKRLKTLEILGPKSVTDFSVEDCLVVG